jgi:RNA polymerase sigma-70 factor, ECF subfamily
VRKRAIDSSHQPLQHFRAWLTRVATNHVIDLIRKRARQPVGLSSLDVAARGEEGDQISFEREVRHQMFHIAATRVQRIVTSAQWQAFWQTSVELQPVQRVAASLNMSVGNVYVCKCRVMERLRKELESIDQGSFAEESQ